MEQMRKSSIYCAAKVRIFFLLHMRLKILVISFSIRSFFVLLLFAYLFLIFLETRKMQPGLDDMSNHLKRYMY